MAPRDATVTSIDIEVEDQPSDHDVRVLLAAHEARLMGRLEAWMVRQEQLMVNLSQQLLQRPGIGAGVTATNTNNTDQNNSSRTSALGSDFDGLVQAVGSQPFGESVASQPVLESVGSLPTRPTRESAVVRWATTDATQETPPPGSVASSAPTHLGPRVDGGRRGAGSADLPVEISTVSAARGTKRKATMANEKIHRMLNDPHSSWHANVFEQTMLLFIIASVIFSLLEIVYFPLKPLWVYFVIEICVELIFITELVVRFSTTPSLKSFATNSYNLVDLAAVLPVVLRLVLGFGAPWRDDADDEILERMWLFAVVPFLRLIKMVRRMRKFNLLVKAFQLAFDALPVFVFIYTTLILCFSAFIYMVEPRDNIEKFGDSVWLTVVTMTTLGYGDSYPITVGGRVAVGILTFSTMLYSGIPIGIIGAAFEGVWSDRDRVLLFDATRRMLQENGVTAASIPEVFDKFDRDRDGHLNHREFRRMVRDLRLGIKDDRADLLFTTFDEDRSGKIDDKEFVKCLFPGEYRNIYGNSDM